MFVAIKLNLRMATKNFGCRSRFRNPGLWSSVQRFLIAFPSSYLAERGFSAVATLVTIGFMLLNAATYRCF